MRRKETEVLQSKGGYDNEHWRKKSKRRTKKINGLIKQSDMKATGVCAGDVEGRDKWKFKKTEADSQ